MNISGEASLTSVTLIVTVSVLSDPSELTARIVMSWLVAVS